MNLFRDLCFSLILGTSLAYQPVMAFNTKAIQQELDEYNYFSKIPGSSLSLCQQEQCIKVSRGYSDKSKLIPMTTDKLFRAGSMTKPMVAVLIMKLVEDQILSLDDTLGTLLPEYTKWAKVTVRQMLRMESGIPAYLFTAKGLGGIVLDIIQEKQVYYKPEDLLNSIQYKELDYVPGKYSIYNNSNYVLLGLIAEKLTKQKLKVLLEQEIFTPLGLEDSYLDNGGFKNPRLAAGFIYSQFTGIPSMFSRILPKDLRRDFGGIDISYGFHPSRTWAAGAVVSSPSDMNRFMRALLDGELVKPESLEAMKDFVPSFVVGAPVLYGLGIMKISHPVGDLYGHGGVSIGYQNMTYYMPSEDISFSIAQNVGPGPTVAVSTDLLSKFLNGFNTKYFDTQEAQYPVNIKRSLHLRVKGRIKDRSVEGERAHASMGYGKWTNYLGLGQSYNNLDTELLSIKNVEYIKIIARDQTTIGGLIPQTGDHIKKDQAILFLDKDKISQLRSSGIEHFSGKLQQSAGVIGVTGQRKTSKKDGTSKFCVSHILASNRNLTFKIGGNYGEDFRAGETLKLVGNFPLRKVRKSDRDFLKTFQFEICK